MKLLNYVSICLLFAIACSSINLQAQGTDNKKIDSLKLVLESELSLEDRVTTLHFLGRDYNGLRDYQSALKAFENAMSLVRNSTDKDLFSSILISLANQYQVLRDLSRADSLATYILKVKEEGFSDSTKNELALNALYIKGTVNSYMGRPDSSIYYFELTEALAIKMQRKQRIISTQGALASIHAYQGEYSKAIEAYQRVLNSLDPQNTRSRQRNYYNLAIAYKGIKDYRKSIETNGKAIEIALNTLDIQDFSVFAQLDLMTHLEINELDSVELKLKAYKQTLAEHEFELQLGIQHQLYFIETTLAYQQHDTTTFVKKILEYRKLIPEDQAEQILQVRTYLMNYYQKMVDYHQMFGRYDQGLRLLHKSKLLAEENERLDMVVDIYPRLIELYELKEDFENALVFQKEYMAAKDSLFNEKKALDIGRAENQLQLSQQENDLLQAEAEITNQRFVIIVSVVGIVALVVIVGISYRAYRVKRAANFSLDRKNEELGLALENLETAQGQLIASEKLASMGRLYAGLAHEINNPLVFVKSGVDTLERELTKPLIEQEKGSFDWVLDIIKDGIKRVQVIVNSISHYSSETNDVASSENVNETIDSILTLMQSEIKDTIKINKHYHDIPSIAFSKGQLGQVFMNILVNAIQAMNGRGEINIETKQINDELVISFQDTGHGMNEEIKEKIFEPFFTTKPPGEGLGLGLHISRSTVQANNGEIIAESKGPGKGSTFIVKLRLTA